MSLFNFYKPAPPEEVKWKPTIAGLQRIQALIEYDAILLDVTSGVFKLSLKGSAVAELKMPGGYRSGDMVTIGGLTGFVLIDQ